MAPQLDLTPTQLALVQQVLNEQVPHARAMAFGSRVTGKARRFSDLDLALHAPAPLDWRTLARLREAFEASNLDICVDVVDWAQTSDSFRQAVLATPTVWLD